MQVLYTSRSCNYIIPWLIFNMCADLVLSVIIFSFTNSLTVGHYIKMAANIIGILCHLNSFWPTYLWFLKLGSTTTTYSSTTTPPPPPPPPLKFLPLDIIFETFGILSCLDSLLGYSTGKFATDCPCVVWRRGLTNHFSPVWWPIFGNLVWTDSGFLSSIAFN